MHNYKKVVDLSNELIASVEARDGLLMQQKMDALERAYKEEFGNSLGNYDAFVVLPRESKNRKRIRR